MAKHVTPNDLRRGLRFLRRDEDVRKLIATKLVFSSSAEEDIREIKEYVKEVVEVLTHFKAVVGKSYKLAQACRRWAAVDSVPSYVHTAVEELERELQT